MNSSCKVSNYKYVISTTTVENVATSIFTAILVKILVTILVNIVVFRAALKKVGFLENCEQRGILGFHVTSHI